MHGLVVLPGPAHLSLQVKTSEFSSFQAASILSPAFVLNLILHCIEHFVSGLGYRLLRRESRVIGLCGARSRNCERLQTTQSVTRVWEKCESGAMILGARVLIGSCWIRVEPLE
jgi:hypothetical protein